MTIAPTIGLYVEDRQRDWFGPQYSGSFHCVAGIPQGSEISEHVIAEPRVSARFWWGSLK